MFSHVRGLATSRDQTYSVRMAARFQVPDSARWALTHGLIRLVLRSEARKGNENTRFLTAPEVRDNPYPHYESLRGSEPFARGLVDFLRTPIHGSYAGRVEVF